MSKTTTCASTRTRLHVTAHAYAAVMTRVLHPYSGYAIYCIKLIMEAAFSFK